MSLELELSVLREAVLVLNHSLLSLAQEIKELRCEKNQAAPAGAQQTTPTSSTSSETAPPSPASQSSSDEPKTPSPAESPAATGTSDAQSDWINDAPTPLPQAKSAPKKRGRPKGYKVPPRPADPDATIPIPTLLADQVTQTQQAFDDTRLLPTVPIPVSARFEGAPAQALVYKDVSNAIAGLVVKCGREAAITLLGSFNVSNARELKEADWPLFMSHASAMAQGG